MILDPKEMKLKNLWNSHWGWTLGIWLYLILLQNQHENHVLLPSLFVLTENEKN